MLTITNQELQKFVGATANMTVDDCSDDLQTALKRYVLPVISEEQLKDSITKSAIQNNIQDLHLQILTMVKRAVCNFAMAKGYMKYVLQLEPSGLKDNTAKEQKASKEDKEAHREDFWKEGFETLEELLQFLEAKKEHFFPWSSSKSYSIAKDCFLPSATIFSEYVGINNSRRTFLKLLTHIRTCQALDINPKFSPDVLDSLITKIKADNLSTIENGIVEHIRFILANYAIADALLKGSIIKGDYDSFTVYDDTGLSKTQGKRTAEIERLKKVQNEHRITAKKFEGLLAEYLKNNNYNPNTSPKEGLNFKNIPSNSFVLI